MVLVLILNLIALVSAAVVVIIVVVVQPLVVVLVGCCWCRSLARSLAAHLRSPPTFGEYSSISLDRFQVSEVDDRRVGGT